MRHTSSLEIKLKSNEQRRQVRNRGSGKTREVDPRREVNRNGPRRGSGGKEYRKLFYKG